MGASMPRALDLIAGGWETSGIITLRSGLPFSIFSGIDNANIGSTTNLELADVLKLTNTFRLRPEPGALVRHVRVRDTGPEHDWYVVA